MLSTKLYIPRRQTLSEQTTLVARPRLLEKLEAGLARKLMLIAAPAGFGKSTLLSEWIDEPVASVPSSTAPESPSAAPFNPTEQPTDRPTFCWLSLEEGDNDPVRFWVYFIAALHSLNPGLSANTPTLLQSPEPPPLETILTILLNDLSAWSPERAPGIVLILEDYHVIVTPEIHQSLAFLLDHLPPTLHLVMTTRSDPPLPVARLRASGQLSEIRADDLRFTAEETALFLNEHMALHLSSSEVQLLAIRTEGWIVGLRLAALSMQGREDKTDFLRSFSGGHRYILNYLIEEVLQQQPQTIQEFLLRTSILTRLCGSLCDAVLEVGGPRSHPYTLTLQANSQSMLAQLVQANLFLIPLDDQDQWYRYHQLFAEVLQHRLRQNQPEILPTLHHRASLWYAAQKYPADAIKHALLATNFSYAAELIESEWLVLWNQGAIATLFNWMQALPIDSSSTGTSPSGTSPSGTSPSGTSPSGTSPSDTWPNNALCGRPSLYVSYAWGLALTGQIEAAELCLSHVEAALEYTGTNAATIIEQYTEKNTVALPTERTLLGRTAALRSMLAVRRGVSADATFLAEQALTLIPIDSLARNDAYYALGLAKQQQGLLTEAYQAYESAEKLSVAANDSFLRIAARYHEARLLMAQGHLQKAAAMYEQMLAVAANSKKQLPVIGLAHVGYGEILYQRNDLVAAAHQVETGLALSPRRDLTYTDGPLHRFSILARIRQAVGDREGALAAIGLAKESAQQTGIALDIERAAAIEALIHLRLGDLALAEQWAERYVRRRTDAERFTSLHEFETLVFVRFLLAQDRVGEALILLEQWLPLVENSQRQGSVLELSVLQALAYHLGKQSEAAMHTFAHALALVGTEDYVRLFVDEGEGMRLAMADFRTWLGKQSNTDGQAVLLNYTNTLLSSFVTPEAPLAQSSATATTANQALIEPLTARELEVLGLLADGLSSASIAKQLVVTVGTIKTHLKHIYRKLKVHSRTQAVAQARTLRLL